MVTESPYKKALSMTGMGAIMGVIFFFSGLSQLATMPRPNWTLTIMGLLMMIVFTLLFLWVDEHGQKYLSTTGYKGGRPFADISFFKDFR